MVLPFVLYCVTYVSDFIYFVLQVNDEIGVDDTKVIETHIL